MATRSAARNPWTPEMRRSLAGYKAKGVRVSTGNGPGTIASQIFGGPAALFMIVLDRPILLDDVLERYPDAAEEEWLGGVFRRKPSKAEKQDELRR